MTDHKPVRFSVKDTDNYEEKQKFDRNVDTNINIPLTQPQRLEFGYPDVDNLMKQRGIQCDWERAYLCTCLNPMTKAPQSNCPYCHGRGVAYLEPEVTIVAIQSQDRSVSNLDIGLYDSGTAIGTTLPNVGISFRDRLSLKGVKINQSITFNANQYRIENGYWIPYQVDDITFAVAGRRNHDDHTISQARIEEGKDYKFDSKRSMIYLRKSYQGFNISLNLRVTLRYLVYDLLKESRYQYTNKDTGRERLDALPEKLLLKREDAFNDPFDFEREHQDADIEEKEIHDPKRPMNRGGFFPDIPSDS